MGQRRRLPVLWAASRASTPGCNAAGLLLLTAWTGGAPRPGPSAPPGSAWAAQTRLEEGHEWDGGCVSAVAWGGGKSLSTPGTRSAASLQHVQACSHLCRSCCLETVSLHRSREASRRPGTAAATQTAACQALCVMSATTAGGMTGTMKARWSGDRCAHASSSCATHLLQYRPNSSLQGVGTGKLCGSASTCQENWSPATAALARKQEQSTDAAVHRCCCCCSSWCVLPPPC